MKLTAYIDRANRWFFRLTDADGAVVADNASPIDDKTAFDVTAATPLSAVLAEGNDANGTTITGLPEPSADTEAATKKYVDDNAGGPGGTPTLAEVLAEGNETGGTEIAAGPVVSTGSTGAKLQMEEGSQSATPGGNAILQGGAGAPTQDGGYSAIAGGQGEDEESTPVGAASITAYGGSADGSPGKVEITTNNTDGALGHVLVSDGIYDTWQAVVTDVSSTPVGGGYVTPLVADTTGKKLYAWTGADYVQIGDWT